MKDQVVVTYRTNKYARLAGVTKMDRQVVRCSADQLVRILEKKQCQARKGDFEAIELYQANMLQDGSIQVELRATFSFKTFDESLRVSKTELEVWLSKKQERLPTIFEAPQGAGFQADSPSSVISVLPKITSS